MLAFRISTELWPLIDINVRVFFTLARQFFEKEGTA